MKNFFGNLTIWLFFLFNRKLRTAEILYVPLYIFQKEKNDYAKHSRFLCSTYTILIFRCKVIYRKNIKLPVLKLLSWNCMSDKSKTSSGKEMNISPFLFPQVLLLPFYRMVLHPSFLTFVYSYKHGNDILNII